MNKIKKQTVIISIIILVCILAIGSLTWVIYDKRSKLGFGGDDNASGQHDRDNFGSNGNGHGGSGSHSFGSMNGDGLNVFNTNPNGHSNNGNGSGNGGQNGNGDGNGNGNGNGNGGSNDGIHGVFGDGNSNGNHNGSVNGNGGGSNHHADTPPDGSKGRKKAENQIACSEEAFQKAMDAMYGDGAPSVGVPGFEGFDSTDVNEDNVGDIADKGDKNLQSLKDFQKALEQNRKHQNDAFKNSMKNFEC